MNIAEEKARLRADIKSKLSKLLSDEKSEASQRILETVSTLPVFQSARSVMAYASLESELDTSSLLALVLTSGRELWLPYCDEKTHEIWPVRVTDPRRDLERGSYGILSPKRPSNFTPIQDLKINLVFVPGLAFDKTGHRLGRGLAYYDRFLAQLPKSVVKIGLAFRCQIVDKVPTEKSDVVLDEVIAV